jgi:hypothetical protein
MFERRLAEEGKVSFQRGEIDASKVCHISAGKMRGAGGNGSAGPEVGRLAKRCLKVLIRMLTDQMSEVPSRLFERIRTLLPSPFIPSLSSVSATFLKTWFAPH